MFSIEELILYAVGLILVSVGGYVIRLLKKKGVIVKLKQQDILIKIAVQSVQQSYKNLRGEQKLSIAKKQFIELAAAHGLKFNENQIDHLVNSAVKELKKDFGEAWNN